MAIENIDPDRFVLRFSCADAPGIVHAVSHVLVEHGCSIGESQQYGDPDTQQFFMRVQFVGVNGPVAVDSLRTGIGSVAQKFSMAWELRTVDVQQRVIIMVSKFGHCLNDLLYRQRIGALDVVIPAVVSNHNEFRDLVESYDIDFHYIPVTTETKADAEEALLRRWYVERFMTLRETAFRNPRSFFGKYVELSEGEALETANGLWSRINLPNLIENIQPTRPRADLILRKGDSHGIEEVSLRKL